MKDQTKLTTALVWLGLVCSIVSLFYFSIVSAIEYGKKRGSMFVMPIPHIVEVQKEVVVDIKDDLPDYKARMKRKAGKLEVLSFKLDPIQCFCNWTMYRWDDENCPGYQCSAPAHVDIRFENGTLKVGDEVHVECIYYSLNSVKRGLDSYIKREVFYLNVNPGKYTRYGLTTDLHHPRARSQHVGKNLRVGLDCSIVESELPPLDKVARIPNRIVDTKHDKDGDKQP